MASKYNKTAIVTSATLLFQIGSWHIYRATFLHKTATLILRYPIQPRLVHLKRITNYIFYGTEATE